MTRLIAFMSLLLLVGAAVAQAPKDDAAAERQRQERAAADKAVIDMIHDAYPPLFEHIQVTIEELKPLQIAHDRKTDKDVGSLTTFNVMLKNIGKNDFGFTPGNIEIQVMDSDGNAIPADRVDRMESGHGDSGTYAIEPGHKSGKPIILAIHDDVVKLGTKYSIIATYVKLWEKPALHYDSLSTLRAVDVVPAKTKATDAKNTAP